MHGFMFALITVLVIVNISLAFRKHVPKRTNYITAACLIPSSRVADIRNLDPFPPLPAVVSTSPFDTPAAGGDGGKKDGATFARENAHSTAKYSISQPRDCPGLMGGGAEIELYEAAGSVNEEMTNGMLDEVTVTNGMQVRTIQAQNLAARAAQHEGYS